MIESLVTMPYPLSRETQALKDKLDAETARHNEAQESATAEESELNALPIEDRTEKAEAKVRRQKVELIADEIGIRKRREDYYIRLQEFDHGKAVDAAIASEESVRNEVAAGFSASGYAPAQVHAMTLASPRVRAVTETRDSLHGARPWHEQRCDNQRRLETAQGRLEAIKARGAITA